MTTLSPSLPDQQRRTTRQSVQFSSCSTLDRARSSAGRDLLLTSSKPCTDEADTSSDEEGGVFFGAHDALETQLVAKLSHDSPCSSCSASPARRSSTRVPRVKKRDSREFIRRKTLLLSAKENSERNEPGSSKGEKTWAGGFYEWRDEDESGVDWEASFSSTPMTFRQTSSHADGTPSRRAVVPAQSDLTLDFSAFRLSDTPLTSVSSSEVNEKEGAASLSGPRASEEDEVYVGDNGDSEAGDSDKENSAMPISPETDSSDDEDVGPMKGLVVTFGLDAMEAGGFLGDATEHENGIEGLDLGGLRVSDFSDPDTGCENGVGDPYDEAGLDCDELNSTDWESIVGEAELETRDSTGVQLENEAEQTAMSRGEDEETIKLAAEISITELASESEVSELFQTPAVTTGATADPDTSSSPTDLDSPLPISRAGPVIIPQLGSHHLPSRTIRADPGSPFRPLSRLSSPAQAYTSLSDTAAEAAILLGQLDSPNSSPVRAESKPAIIMTPLHLAPQPTNATPSTAKPTAFVVGSDAVARNNKILKPSLAGFTIPGSLDRSKSGPSEKKVVARTLAIRGQLDAAFQPKMGTMGPPQRAVSSSSASSSSSSSSFGQQRPHSRLGAAGPSKPSRPLGRSADLSISREVSPKRSIAGAKPPASRPQQYMAGFNRSLAINKGTIECSPVTVTSSTAARSRSAFAPSALNGAARPALAPRLLSQPMGRSSVSIGVSSKVSRPPPMPKPVTIVKPTKPITASPQKMIGDPLKRPLALAQPQMARLPIAANGLHVTRPTLGLPSRFVRETSSMQATAVFSIGVGGGGESIGLGNPSLSRAGFRSPVRPLVKRPVADASLGTPAGLRVMKLGTPSRNFGTPSQGRTLPRPILLSHAPLVAKSDVAAIEPSTSSGPPATATRHSSEAAPPAESSTSGPPRRSSEDQEDVSFQLLQATSSEQGSSPSRDSSRTPASRVALDSEEQAEEQDARVSPGSEKSRPKRAIRPPQPVTSQRGRQPAPTSASIAPNLSEKELKSTTHHNTMRNQVYLCAIDRQIVRKTGPRPPSPTSKIRTTADRDEAEKNAGREARAKRRSRGSDGDTESDSEDDVHSSVVERLTHVRGPGDEDDYTTPARPAKKAKTAHEHEGPAKSVKWDKGLVVIRPHDGPSEGSRPVSRSSTIEDKGSKGCLRDDAKVELDQHGNVIESRRPQEKLKRSRVVVTAVFYDGEEPVPPPAPVTAGGGKGKKK